MDENPPFNKNGRDNGSSAHEYEQWIDNRLNGLLNTTPQSLEEWSSWVSKGLRETGVQLTEGQEMVILLGFYRAFRQRGFDMCYCPDEKPTASCPTSICPTT